MRGDDCQASGKGSNKIRKKAWGESKEQREDRQTGREERFATGCLFNGIEGGMVAWNTNPGSCCDVYYFLPYLQAAPAR